VTPPVAYGGRSVLGLTSDESFPLRRRQNAETAEPAMAIVTSKPGNTAARRLSAVIGAKNEVAFVAIADVKKLD
jgi:hypothetical protein